jgi:hypothetical protein
MNFQHNILIVLKSGIEVETISLLQDFFSVHLLTAGQAVSPLALYLAAPHHGRARVTYNFNCFWGVFLPFRSLFVL